MAILLLRLAQNESPRTCALTLHHIFAVSRRVLLRWTVHFHLHFHWGLTGGVQLYCPVHLNIVLLEGVAFYPYPSVLQPERASLTLT